MIGQSPTSSAGFDGLRSQLHLLQEKGELTAQTLGQVIEQSYAAGVRITPKQASSLYGELGHAREIGAPDYLRQIARILFAPGRADLGLTSAALHLAAPKGAKINETGTRGAIAMIASVHAARGIGPKEATERARRSVLGELGVGLGGSTQHPIGDGAVVDLAAEFGDPFALHTQHYQHFLADRLWQQGRNTVRAFAKQLDPADPQLVDAIGRANSFAALVDVLSAARQLGPACSFAAHHSDPPLSAAFRSLNNSSDLRIAAGMRTLDHPKVRVVQTDESDLLSPTSVLAIEIGDVSVLDIVGPSMTRQLRVAAATQRAVRALIKPWGATKFAFKNGDPTFNTQFFESDGERGFRLKPGQSASAALADIIEHPRHYRIECATGMVLMYHLVEYELCKEQRGERADEIFDERFEEMRIGPWRHGPALQLEEHPINPGDHVAMPGQGLYLRTSDVDPMGVARGWQGQNMVYFGKAQEDGEFWSGKGGSVNQVRKGDDLYWGHPFGLTTKDDILQLIDGQRFHIRMQAAPELKSHIAQLRKLGLEENDTVVNRLSTLEKIADRLSQSEQRRITFAQLLQQSEPERLDLEDAAATARIKFGHRSSEYRQAKARWDKLRKGLNNEDSKLDQFDARTRAMVERHISTLASQGIGDAESLKAEIALMRELLPRGSSLAPMALSLAPKLS